MEKTSCKRTVNEMHWQSKKMKIKIFENDSFLVSKKEMLDKLKRTKKTATDRSKRGTAHYMASVQFSSVAQSCPTLCNHMNRSTLGLPVHHQLPEFTQTHVHWDSDAIQPTHSLSSPSPPALNLSQHQGLFKWVSSLHHVAKVLEFQLQHQSFQWTPRTDLL